MTKDEASEVDSMVDQLLMAQQRRDIATEEFDRIRNRLRVHLHAVVTNDSRATNDNR